MSPPRRSRERASLSLLARPAMIVVRSVSLIALQAAISAVVRPQPMHSAEIGSTTQSFTHGVETAEADIVSI
jgi:hypothetical protein